jgi:hypothetical protein
LKTAESSYLTPLNSEEKNQIKLIFQKDSWWWGEGGGGIFVFISTYSNFSAMIIDTILIGGGQLKQV